jgi:hypothetical protein
MPRLELSFSDLFQSKDFTVDDEVIFGNFLTFKNQPLEIATFVFLFAVPHVNDGF